MTDTPEEQHKTIMDEAERLHKQIKPLGFNDTEAPERHTDALQRAAERRLPATEFDVKVTSDDGKTTQEGSGE